jgi:hypothetical protein
MAPRVGVYRATSRWPFFTHDLRKRVAISGRVPVPPTTKWT